MKDYFRMNALLKILTVMIVGYFIFELLFGIVTGNFGMYGNTAGSSEHHASSSSTSAFYSYDAIINALLLLLVKLTIVIFLLVLISGASKLIKELLSSKEDSSNTYIKSKNTSNLLVITGALIGIMVLYSIFKGFYLGSSEFMQMGLNNVHAYNNYSITIDDFWDIFFNVLLYLTAIILGIEVFKYFMNKQKS